MGCVQVSGNFGPSFSRIFLSNSALLSYLRSDLRLVLPCVCAEKRSGRRIKRRACLSPQGEFARLPPGASIAGCPGAAGVTDTRVAFSLLTFSWRSKRKYLARRGETRLAT